MYILLSSRTDDKQMCFCGVKVNALDIGLTVNLTGGVEGCVINRKPLTNFDFRTQVLLAGLAQ